MFGLSDDRLVLIKQLAKFGIVGGGATLLHAGVMFVAVEYFIATPMVGNIIGYIAAVIFSFTGHNLWTFTEDRSSESIKLIDPKRFMKFWVPSLLGFSVNALAVFTVTHILQVDYKFSFLVIIFVTPILTFTISKYWAFR